LYIEPSVAVEQAARVSALKATRDRSRVVQALAELRRVAGSSGNLMYPILDAARAYATLGEMCDALREVFGEYDEPAFF
jgi:methylmalonyl-CoA mutase N-terminal domain/subunit